MSMKNETNGTSEDQSISYKILSTYIFIYSPDLNDELYKLTSKWY